MSGERRRGALTRAIAIASLVTALAASLIIPAAVALAPALETEGRVATRLRPLPERSTVYAADGSIIATLGTRNRAIVHHLADIPDVVLDAVVAAEDRTYWTNGGVDVPAMGRALIANLESGGAEQGASTIAQQLVKNRILGPHKTMARKVEELVLAYRLKRELGARRVLLEYLNTVYFGENAYGVATAAERITGKPLDQLTGADAALLAGMIRSPATTNPFDEPAAALERRAEVLDAMVARGALTRAEAGVAAAAPLPSAATRPPADLRPRSYFVAEVQRRLLADPHLGATPAARARTLLRGGLRIETTLDPRLQMLAERAVLDTVPPGGFTAAVAAVDPRTGAVRAIVGGPEFADAQYDLATQGVRQPGSTFKVVALATALQHGYSPEDLVDGASNCAFSIPGQPIWTPGGGGGGIMTLREATIRSVNCAYARLTFGLGAEKVAAVASAMGVVGPVPAVPSITLGTVEASPLEMATVVGTIAADGVRHDPVFVHRVTDSDGHVLLEQQPAGTRAISTQTARTLADVLQGVIASGTGTGARIDRPAFGKTGSTDDNADAWFVGATPELAAAVWMGDPRGRTPMTDVGGQIVFGGSYPATIWSRFVQAATAGTAPVDFPAPDVALWPAPAFASESGRGPIPAPPPPPPPPPRAAPPPPRDEPHDDRGPKPGRRDDD